MISSRMAREPALLAVLSVLMIFLFPAMQGPYSAVHGPATALQAARAAVRVKVAIVQAAGLKGLNDGQKVSFDIAMERGKAAATNLKLA